ncbi:MAG: hypothetical protein K0R00_3559 [Herbinix sp.]|nr:hypothetical protein [Herbinix sp.]
MIPFFINNINYLRFTLKNIVCRNCNKYNKGNNNLVKLNIILGGNIKWIIIQTETHQMIQAETLPMSQAEILPITQAEILPMIQTEILLMNQVEILPMIQTEILLMNQVEILPKIQAEILPMIQTDKLVAEAMIYYINLLVFYQLSQYKMMTCDKY